MPGFARTHTQAVFASAALLFALAGCQGTQVYPNLQQHLISLRPGDLEAAGIAFITPSTVTGQEQEKQAVALTFADVMKRERQGLRVVTLAETLGAVNKAGLADDYRRMYDDYRDTGLLSREVLRQVEVPDGLAREEDLEDAGEVADDVAGRGEHERVAGVELAGDSQLDDAARQVADVALEEGVASDDLDLVPAAHEADRQQAGGGDQLDRSPDGQVADRVPIGLPRIDLLRRRPPVPAGERRRGVSGRCPGHRSTPRPARVRPGNAWRSWR